MSQTFRPIGGAVCRRLRTGGAGGRILGPHYTCIIILAVLLYAYM